MQTSTIDRRNFLAPASNLRMDGHQAKVDRDNHQFVSRDTSHTRMAGCRPEKAQSSRGWANFQPTREAALDSHEFSKNSVSQNRPEDKPPAIDGTCRETH